jgi:hypothetical protein
MEIGKPFKEHKIVCYSGFKYKYYIQLISTKQLDYHKTKNVPNNPVYPLISPTYSKLICF